MPAFQNLFDQFGCHFVRQMVTWLWNQTLESDAVMVEYTFVELAFFWGTQRTDDLPRPHKARKAVWTTNVSNFQVGETLTVALVLRLIRHFFNAASFCEMALCHQINLTAFGVATPLSGVKLSISQTLARQILQQISCFTLRRPIRRANDLARPFSLSN